jgi:hypothetical protein
MANSLKNSYVIAQFDSLGRLLKWRLLRVGAKVPDGWVVVV